MTLDGIDLSPYGAFLWPNEFTWSPVAQHQDRAVTGALIVQEQAKLYGREIDLDGSRSVWVPRSVLLTLKAKEEIEGHEFDVTLDDGQQFRCMFNRVGGTGIDAGGVRPYATPDGTTLYQINRIRLITVEP